MRRTLALLLLIAPLAAQDPSLREQIDEIHRTLSSAERDLPRLIERAKPLLKLDHGREAIADAAEDPRNRLGWNATVKGRLPGWWVMPGAKVGRESGGFLVEKGPVEFQGTFNRKDLSVTMTFEVGRGATVDGREAKFILTQTLTFPSPEAYNQALGIDPSRWRGVREVLGAMERTVPWLRRDAPASAEPRSITSVDEAGREVMRALRGRVPDMFDAATQYESVTLGYGVRVGRAKGKKFAGSGLGAKVQLEHMRHTRYKRGETKGVSFASTGVGFGLGGRVADPIGLTKIEGELSASITRSDDPAQRADPDQKVLARMIRNREIEGLVAETYQRASVELSPRARNLALGTGLLPHRRLDRVLESAAVRATDLAREEARRLEGRARDAMNTLQQDAKVVYRRGEEGAVEVYMRLEDGTHRALRVVGDELEVYELETRKRYRLGRAEAGRLLEKVGGVKLDVAADIVRALDAGPVDRQVVLVEGRVVLVSLKNLARRFTEAGGWREAGRDLTEPGALSRVHGYVRVDDDVVLLGTRQADHPSVRLEDLVVALRWVWEKKQAPGCSLDALPGDPGGPQTSRVLGVPKDSRFAKVMLDADYRMKRITLGDLPSGVPGLRTLRDVARPGMTANSRFWFYPLRPAREQLQASPSRDAALFIANLEVRTEAKKLAASGFAAAGGGSQAMETLARSFTENFGAVARRHRIFAELRTLLDLTVLARLLRHAGIDVRCLRELAAVDHPPVKVPTSYAGVHVVLWMTQEGLPYGAQGGVELRQRLGRRLMASREDLQFLRLRSAATELSRSGEVARTTEERSLVISPLTFRLGEIEGLMRDGQAAATSGDLERAVQIFASVLAREPGLPEALAHRAVCALQLGDLPAAERDIEAAVREDPTDEHFRDLAETIAFLGGKRPLRDPQLKRHVADAATRRAELNEARGKHDLAAKDLAVAIAADPGHFQAHVARAMLRQSGNKFWDALEDWETVVRLQPEWFAAYTNRAIAKLNVADYWGAIDDGDLAIGLNPYHFLAFWARGTAKSQVGDDAGAIEDFDEAIRLEPGFATSFRNRAYAKFKNGVPKGWAADMVTNLALRGEEGERSEFSRSRQFYLDTCGRVLRREPSFGPAHAVRGLVYLHDGAWADAVRDLDEALAHPPRHPGLRVPGRHLATSMKQYAAALRQLERDRAYLLFRRARAHLELSNRAAALADLDAAVRLDPGLRQRADALR